jgi:hypothetical protein
VWHERWGEDYDGRGGCTKYTDKVSLHVSNRNGPEKCHARDCGASSMGQTFLPPILICQTDAATGTDGSARYSNFQRW